LEPPCNLDVSGERVVQVAVSVGRPSIRNLIPAG
jgi:hypothetical protein